MSLATVIRMEFAYPGVGILAGDSIQYLSIATAHGVIMVFFMIMPAIFGAFGNFLLPTQLGVHDVAFPRLNSAAFWFLPGGLLMLCQLVCVDRRYQRMNCFNIRELQGILKRKFFTDLVNTSDGHKAMEPTLINMRHKNNMSNILLYDQSLFYNFDLTSTSKSKSYSFTPGKIYTYTVNNLGHNLNTLVPSNNFFGGIQITYSINIIYTIIKDLLSYIYLPSVYNLLTTLNSISYIYSNITNTLYLNVNSVFNNYNYFTKSENNNYIDSVNNIYKSSTLNYNNFSKSSQFSYSENSSS
jgi:hypothetical protein